MAKTIVVLGANFSGLPVAHYLLSRTSQKVKDLKVIVVSPSTHFYWHLATVRAILPDMLPDDKIFLPIAPTFAKYRSEQYELVLGKAKKLDPNNNSVEVATNEGEHRTIKYDAVIIATGSTFKEGMPFKMLSSMEETKARLHEYRKRVASAKSIVVAGAGFTGVELAGELGTEHGSKKQITLIMDKDLPLLEKYKTDVREVARKDLQKLNVKLVTNARVTAVSPTAPDGPVTLELTKNGGKKETLEADLYLPTFGVSPNTQYLPDSMLDANGYVNQTKELRALGYDNIFVVGDAGNLEAPQGVVADKQAIHLVKILGAYLTGEAIPEYQVDPKIMFGLSLGKSKGTGQMGNWRPWGFLIAYMKSRYLGTDYAPAFVAGTRTITARSWA
ncbi:putative FAD binding protein [Thozetella sp. PMI_491]|nr:putative FAD binding protein [Thozetella sp. PMI_491]